MFLKFPILSLSLLAFTLLFSCGKKKGCPGFSDNLVPYVPQESRLVFHNSAGDSLVFSTTRYERVGPHTEKQNGWSVGGSGGKPYCVCSSNIGSASSDQQELDYGINVDNEALTCTLSVNLSSKIPSNDYFRSSSTAYSSEGRPFGDTLKLDNSTPTTSPRYSRIEIVYGRGITRIQDDVKKCLWVR